MIGGVPGDLTRAAETASSAVASVDSGVELHSDRRTTGHHLEVLVDDSLETVLGVRSSVATLDIVSGDESRRRADLLDRLDDTVSTFIGVHEYVKSVPGAPDSAEIRNDLAGLAETLDAFAEGKP